jgi:rod shape-determining protein MreC|tara:strand:- start:1211 stop:2434 length:1224 start_codon:yes stop_codon:yes gene_type:complete
MDSNRDDFIIAIRSAFLKKNNKQRFSLLGLIFFSIIFIVLGTLNLKTIDYLKISIKELVYRSSFIVSVPENFLVNSITKISNHFNHYDNYKQIEFDLENLRSKNLSKRIITLENMKLKKLIDDYFIETNEVYAKVLIDKNSPFLRSIVLNKGSKNNIKLGMVVLDGMYLIGKVVEVNYFTSRVLLLSDINSKIPVTLEPIGVQAIMSGKNELTGILQYTKEGSDLKKVDEDLLVFTSGAGGLYKSGIPIGKIKKENVLIGKEKVVDFYKDFSQLKYVKVLSFSKEGNAVLDQSQKEAAKKIDEKIIETKRDKENLRLLLEQKKISKEIRAKIEEENNILKNRLIKLQNEISIAVKTIEKNKIKKEEMKFSELKLLYGKKCKKNVFNKLYIEGTAQYKKCVLNRGPKN